MRSSKKLYIFAALSILTALFIFGNSIQPAQTSQGMSDGFLKFLYPVITKILPFLTEDTVSFLIRKCAHITEFAVLGVFVMLTLFEMGKIPHRAAIYTMFSGLLTACIDEQIQFFIPGRSCEVRDVLVDFSGIIIGICVVLVIRKLLKKPEKIKLHTSGSAYFRSKLDD